MSIGEKIKELRARAGWTQSELAKVAEVPFRSVQNWESGHREPKLKALSALAKAFGVKIDDLLSAEP